MRYQPRGELDWCERHLDAEQSAVSDPGLTTRFDKYTYGQPDILSHVPEHVDGVRATCLQEGLGVAGTWQRVIEKALTGLNKYQGK